MFPVRRHVEDEPDDRGKEDRAGQDRAEVQATVFSRWGQQVSERRAERTGEDVGDPERPDAVELQAVVASGGRREIIPNRIPVAIQPRPKCSATRSSAPVPWAKR